MGRQGGRSTTRARGQQRSRCGPLLPPARAQRGEILPPAHGPAGGKFNAETGEWNSKKAAAYPGLMNVFIGLGLAYSVHDIKNRKMVREQLAHAKRHSKSSDLEDLGAHTLSLNAEALNCAYFL